MRRYFLVIVALLGVACSLNEPLSASECTNFRFAGGVVHKIRAEVVRTLDTRTGWFGSRETVISMEIELPGMDQLDLGATVRTVRLEAPFKTEKIEEFGCFELPRNGYVHCYYDLPNAPILLSAVLEPHDGFDPASAMNELADRVLAAVLDCP